MIGREDIEVRYDQLKSLKAEISASKDKLERNRNAIEVNGEIPDKYKSAFNRLATSIKNMEEQYDNLIVEVAPIEEEYVLSVISGNLLFFNDEEGKNFVKKAYSLKQTRLDLIRKAENSFDVDALDDILMGLRTKFVTEEFDNYTKYAQEKNKVNFPAVA
ncbi:MAG: hypothetical protein J6I68_11465 [Butyrivibrio sp.]|uniref:hypothetical protein n=1 Tax=Butyrivibrio sp. TaxID=28121 RepID=UPI001B47EE9A|nr:hypothetical protein [Butyrivibrio sp.]MBP3783854.1 hypothetical protein [Butyrivibrio sp.]